MSKLIEDFASMTASRSRAALDRSVAQLIHELLQPRRTEIFQRQGPGVEACWLGTACLPEADRRDDATPAPLAGDAQRLRCAETAAWVLIDGEAARTIVPLCVGGSVVGVVDVAHARPLDAAQQATLGSLVRFYCNLCELLDENERDALTGLLNRKSFDETFTRAAFAEGAPAVAVGTERRGSPRWPQTWLAIVDIDHFKQVNDSHGHLIGDEVLVLVSRLLRQSLRGHDLVYRFGGEEFVLLLRDAAAEHVGAIFERVRCAIEQFDFPRVGRVTVSIGSTRITEDDTPTHAFDRADRAVYGAKAGGRNRCCAYRADAGAPEAAPPENVEFF
ncbi:MAG: GGDEF domain-containing protein [Burkholderiales bacterium]|nr:GGDEF domain-containing protein [Burkholderiales bacterium]MDE1929795.1 GGDEF domain-containing protein [Burkholderiales bacterium]MDE2160873.1 GGDEF domain-containing protein [Burkholderiales bacterium]MDE2505282.1 GGDEF domain-containing protein [Burkholderiales bacterium]